MHRIVVLGGYGTAGVAIANLLVREAQSILCSPDATSRKPGRQQNI